MVIGAALLALFQLHNDDAFFHIATGRWILSHGEVPLHNPFSYAGDGAIWLQHQWVPAVAMAWLADAFGIAALVCAKAAWVGLVFAVLAWHLDRARLPEGLAASMLAVAVIASAFRFYERPLLVSALALAVVGSALLRWQRDEQRGRALPALAVVTTVLAWHLHAGALHSVLAWCALVGGLALRAVLARWSGPPDQRDVAIRHLRAASGWFVLCVAATLLSLALLAPSGLSVLTLPVRLSANEYWHAHLSEFRPLRWRVSYALQWSGVAMAGVVALWALRQRRWPALLLVVGFTALALRHQRMVWTMTIATVVAVGCLDLGARWTARLRRPVWHTATLILSLALLLAGWMDQDRWFRMGLGADGLDQRRHPVHLLTVAAGLPGETFVSDGLAGTWLWLNFRDVDASGQPLDGPQQRRVLVHNCLECYEESTYIDVYQSIRYGEAGWQDKVAALGIRSFVLKYTTPGERRFQGGKPNIRQHLYASEDWLLVDFDDVAAVYVRRDHLPPGLATLADFPVDPDTGRGRSGANHTTIMAALLEHAARRPHVVRSLDMARRRVGRPDQTTGFKSQPGYGNGSIVFEYWRRWTHNRHGWPEEDSVPLAGPVTVGDLAAPATFAPSPRAQDLDGQLGAYQRQE